MHNRTAILALHGTKRKNLLAQSPLSPVSYRSLALAYHECEALQMGNNLVKYGFILDRLYQQSYLNFDNEEQHKSLKCPCTTVDTQHNSTQWVVITV